ncbi:hypothetical protein HJFPF1_04568 [Paramyrothecium foliicola]|nr:hypothetical protein HJFPF1_04568 [Paramyrothecium foliicola]
MSISRTQVGEYPTFDWEGILGESKPRPSASSGLTNATPMAKNNRFGFGFGKSQAMWKLAGGAV